MDRTSRTVYPTLNVKHPRSNTRSAAAFLPISIRNYSGNKSLPKTHALSEQLRYLDRGTRATP